MNKVFKHNDPDECHDNTLTLHDCAAEKIDYSEGVLRFSFPDGIWIFPRHSENKLNKTVRTDAATADFSVEDIDDISVDVFTKGLFGRKTVEIWDMDELMRAVNCGKCVIEFIFQYRTYFEQMWRCAIRSRRKPYYRECQLHLPKTRAVYRWNSLRADREW